MSGNSPQLPPAVAMALAQRMGQNPVLDVFANQIRMGVTVTDFALVFGAAATEQAHLPSGAFGAALVNDRVAVHVAPGTLKQILLQIQMAVAAYESVFGEIQVPRRTLTEIEKHRLSLTEMLRRTMEEEESEVTQGSDA